MHKMESIVLNNIVTFVGVKINYLLSTSSHTSSILSHAA